MDNRITKETWELWADNIEYILDHVLSHEIAAEEILTYLENEGAFCLIKEETK